MLLDLTNEQEMTWGCAYFQWSVAAVTYDDQSCKYQMGTKSIGLLGNETAVGIDRIMHWACVLYGLIVAIRRGWMKRSRNEGAASAQ
jgi:hypothetical protein